jgi:hypothetical protein
MGSAVGGGCTYGGTPAGGTLGVLALVLLLCAYGALRRRRVVARIP